MSNIQNPATLAQRTLGAAFWTFSGNGLQQILRLATIMVLSRLLTAEDFGTFSAALVVVALTEMFASLGVGSAIVQRPELEERHIRVGFSFSLLFGLLLLGIFWFTAPAVAAFYRSETLVPVLRVVAFTFPIIGIAVIAESLMQRELQFRLLARFEVVSYAIGPGIVGIGMAWLGFGLWSLIIAYLIQAIVKSASMLIYQTHPKKLLFDGKTVRELFFFGGGISLGQIFNYFGLQGDNLIVGRWLGIDALGLYGRAFQLMSIPVVLLGNVIDKVMFPAMAKVQHDPKLLALSYCRSIALGGLLILPLSVIEYILAPEIIFVVLGPSWNEIVFPFRILVLGMLFRSSYKISVALTRATGTVYRNAGRQAIYALLVLGSSWIGQYWGLTGVAIGVSIAVLLHFLLMAQLGLSLIAMNWKQLWALYLPSLCCTLIVGSTAWATSMIMRSFYLPPILILGLSMLMTFVVTLLLIQRFPLLFLGSNGVWTMELLRERLPQDWPLLHWLSRRVQQSSRF